MEEELITKEHIPFYSIRAGKLRRYFSLQNLLDVFKVSYGIIQSILLIKTLNPDVIFSKGGYVSLPVVIAAKVLRKRVVIHESDVYPGITTRISSKFASTICVSWQKTLEIFRGKNAVLTGIPVREELKEGSKERGYTFTKLEKNALPVLLVVGGSLGAGKINDFIKENMHTLLEEYNIIHLVGRGKGFSVEIPDQLKDRYVQIEFVGEEMKDIFALTDIVISRAGSTALAEFIYLQKPVIMTPLTKAQSRGDQYDNAEEFMKMYPRTSVMIEEEKLEITLLLKTMIALHNTGKEKSSVTSAVDLITEILLSK